MFDPFLAFVTGFVLPQKQNYSRDVAEKLKTLREPLPVLGRAGNDGRVSMQTLETVNNQCRQLRYNADPLGGAADFYNHPEFTQWMLKFNRWENPCDCDDFAVYAVALLRACGMNHDKVWIWNLLIDPGSQFSQMWANHVICGAEFWDGQRIWTVVIDTNTAAVGRPAYFQGNAEDSKAAVIQHFRNIYKVNYYALVKVPYPF